MIEVLEGEVVEFDLTEHLAGFADAMRDAADAVALAADDIRDLRRVIKVYRLTLERIASRESGVWGDWAREALYGADQVQEGHSGEGVLVDSDGRSASS